MGNENASIYAQDGVDTKEGDSFSNFAGSIARSTYGNSPFVEVHDFSDGHFRGPRGYRFINLPRGCYSTIAPDGIGTKVVLIDACGRYTDAAADVLAMTAGDITRYGGIPLIFSNVLDVAALDKVGNSANNAARQLMLGLKAVADSMKMVVLNGETAELSSCVGSENENATLKFNWAGFVVGVFHPEWMILGKTIRPGQKIMALRENGLGSNGVSTVRKAFKMRFGKNWPNEQEAQRYIKMAAAPSTIYDPFLVNLNWEHDQSSRITLHLISHVTGGSIRDKLARDLLFRLGFSAVLDDLFEPPEIMWQCQGWRNMSDADCYDTWNGGQRVLVVIDAQDVEKFEKIALTFGIETRMCGEIVSTPKGKAPYVKINSKFKEGGEIVYQKGE